MLKLREFSMKVLAIGDSHTKYFGLSNQVVVAHAPARGVTSVAKVISGASVTGVGKLSSTLNVADDIPKWVESFRPDFLVFNLGQVDIELGLPFRKYVKEDGVLPQEHMSRFIQSYLTFLGALDFPKEKVVIKGINLPVLCYDRPRAIKYINRIVTERFTDSPDDLARQESVLKSLQSDYPSDIVRTDLAFLYNKMLEAAVTKAGYSYFDINADLVNPETGLIRTAYVPASFDHHLADSVDTRVLHWKHLLPVLRRQVWA